MKTILLMLAVLSVTGVLSACGPQETSADKDDQQINELIKTQRDLYAPLLGTYVGKLTSPGGKTHDQVELVLLPITSIQVSTTRFNSIEVPALGGSLTFCLKADTCFGAKDLGTDWYTAATFNAAKYDKDSGRLSLIYQVGVSANGTSSNLGASSLAIDAIVDGDHITGTVSSTIKGLLGQLDVKRIK